MDYSKCTISELLYYLEEYNGTDLYSSVLYYLYVKIGIETLFSKQRIKRVKNENKIKKLNIGNRKF